jgi:hypothetical protein
MSFVPTRSAVALAAATAALVAAPAAEAKNPAATPSTSAGPVADACGYTGTSVFAPWNDQRRYTLTPDGGFENAAAGWTLHGGAAVADGNETFQAGGTADHQSLALPAGSSATSPAICVTKHNGVFRLFARTDGNRKARLKVEVLYTNARGHKRSLRVGKLRAGDAWAPTRKLAVVLGLAKGKGKLFTAKISLRFTPVGAGNWQIDDVYLDPRLRQ